MRMRKLPWAEAYIAQADIIIKNQTAHKGKWKQALACDKLHVEIGCGKGDYLLKMSDCSTNSGWIGIEKDSNVMAIAARKYNQQAHPDKHIAFLLGDAQELTEWFAPGEIDVIHLNFSDPWPKKRAHKKRLSHASFITLYREVLCETGEIQMKTDNASLFEFSLLQFQEGGWYLHEISVDYRRNSHDEDAITEYEQRFMNLGQPIYRAVWKKFPYVNMDKKKR